MKILWSPEALTDFERAVTYLLEQHREQAAVALLDAVNETAELLASGGIDGPTSKLTSGEELQSWRLYPFKMRLYYRRHSEGLELVRLYADHQVPIQQ